MLLKIMRFHIPGFVKKKKLQELFRLTADAFQSEPPELKGLSFARCLTEYAIYTRKQAQNYLQSGQPLDAVKFRLYQSSCFFGRNLRKRLGIVTWEEAVTVLQLVYKLIGIDFQYDRQGEFIISRCFFSRYYSGEVCRLMASLDEGLAAGLSDGGRLYFFERITEGGSGCKGYFCKGREL